MRDLIAPIHEMQKMSESEKSHVGCVYPRWLAIKNHLQNLIPLQPSAQPLLMHFESRLHTQTKPIHLVAYYLDPINIGKRDYSMEQFNLILKFIEKYASENAKV